MDIVTSAEIKKACDKVVDDLYRHFRKQHGKSLYREDLHCRMVIRIMINYDTATTENFCVEARISDRTFRQWLAQHELFRDIYYFSRMIAKVRWEDEGRRIKSEYLPIGSMNYEFEHWKMIGWTRFGVSRNSRIKLDLDPKDQPVRHYEKILEQAAQGDFTASEFKQLMEAVNVGLNVQTIYELQKQVNELKSDLAIMQANTSVNNPFPVATITETDQDSMAHSLCESGSQA